MTFKVLFLLALLAPLLLIAAGIVMHPMTPRRALVALLAVVALPALLALTSWLLPTRRVLENESADAFVWQWDADRDGAISRDELKQAVGNRLEHLIEKLFHAAVKNHNGNIARD